VEEMIVKSGATRHVLLTQKWAIKTPRITHWRAFLNGLLANDQEVTFSKMRDARMCSVVFRLPLSFVIVMPRCRTLTVDEHQRFVTNKLQLWDGVPVEVIKPDSFAWLNGNVVAIDYGS
jgi:hypothetical protein